MNIKPKLSRLWVNVCDWFFVSLIIATGVAGGIILAGWVGYKFLMVP